MVLNKTYTDKTVQSIHAIKLYHNNYYLTDDEVAQAALKPILEYLEGLLRACLNFDGSKCDLWRLDSHRECLMLMDILYELTSNENYNTLK
jgi:hypothetical protein